MAEQTTFQGHTHSVLSVCYLPDKDQIVSASADKTLKLWSLMGSGQSCLKTFQGHTSGVRSVCYLPDKDQIVSASFDKTLKLWSLETEQEKKTKEVQKEI